MSDEREFNASSIEEAVEKASSELGLTQDQLSYRVLDEGSSGFLGLGARDARIIVALPESGSDVGEEVALVADTQTVPEEAGTEDQISARRNEPATGEDAVSEELLSTVREHVQALLSSAAFESEVAVIDDGEFIQVNIDSEDSGLLIGQKGETIDSLQYLVNVALYRERPFEKKIVLDVGGYRERRVKAVQGMALRAAKRVSQHGKAVELPPMSASERRAVHTYLKDDTRVTTSSNGKDEDRKITISLA